MPKEKSAGAIIFRREDGKIFYLLLRHSTTGKISRPFWSFPKGHIEKGEKVYKTVKREVEEETSLKDIKILKGFREFDNYFFRIKGETVFKTVIFFLAETKTKEIKLSCEHTSFGWFEYKEALAKIKFKNLRNSLEKADKFLKRNGKA